MPGQIKKIINVYLQTSIRPLMHFRAHFCSRSAPPSAKPSMLYFVGLGLGDAKDITVKGLEIVKKCERVYLEAYTSILTCGKVIKGPRWISL